MPRLATILIILFAGWVIFGAPIPKFSVQPLTPSAKIPTFEKVQSQLAVLRQADKDGLLQQDPVREEQRLAVLEAFARLEKSPCDEGLRREYSKSLIPFLKSDIREADKPPVETFEIDGKVLNATGYLDGKALQTMYVAVYSGYLRSKDLPGAAGIAFALAGKFASEKSKKAQSALKKSGMESGMIVNCDQKN